MEKSKKAYVIYWCSDDQNKQSMNYWSARQRIEGEDTNFLFKEIRKAENFQNLGEI